MAKKEYKQKAVHITGDSRTGPGFSQLHKEPRRFNTSMHVVVAGCIATITWLCYSSSLQNQFTNWDDAGYIVNDPMIKDLSWAGLRSILLNPVMGNYHPITILSYAIEYSYVGLDPWLYHFDNVLLHLGVTLLVYWFSNLLLKRPVAAIVTTLLFALHPMHVETVAWAADRKDLICSLFFMAACISYVGYIQADAGRKSLRYAFSVALFVGAVLSKPTGVTLPMVLLLIDFFVGRSWTRGVFIEKIPYFVLALIFGIMSVSIQHSGGAMAAQKVNYGMLERIALGGYSLITYLWKAVAPIHLCCFYPYPGKINGSLPVSYCLYPLLSIGIILILWRYERKNKIVVFGFLFFMVNILLLLQLIPVGEAIVAERYTYLPYFGLFLIFGWLVSLFFEPGAKEKRKYPVLVVTVTCIGCLGYVSNERCAVWYDSASLWRDEIAKEDGRAPIAYNNMGFIYFDKWASTADTVQKNVYYDSAFLFMTKAVQLKPDFVNAYQGLGMLYYSKKSFESSAYCFRTALRLQPTAEAHSDYANLLNLTGKSDSALLEYAAAIVVNPKLSIAYLNRGRLYKEKNKWEEARRDFDTAISLSPDMGEIYYERSFCDTQKGNRSQALQDVEKAISLGCNQVNERYYNSLKK